MPYVTDGIHVDAVLSNFAVKYRQDKVNFIADLVSPRVPAKKESDKYKIYSQKDLWTLPGSAKRADGTEAKQIKWGLDTDGTYACEEFALKDVVTVRQRKNSDEPLDLDRDTQEFLQDLIMLDRESRVATAVFNATTFASYTSALTVANRWDNYTSADSDPLEDIESAKDSLLSNAGKRANIVIMGYAVYRKLRHHPLIIDRVKGGATTRIPALVGEAELAQAFDVDKVLVGRAVKNDNNIGQTASYSYVWGKFVMTAFVEPNPRAMKGVTMSYSPMAQDVQVSKWFEDKVKGDWIEVGEIIDEVIPCVSAGYLYSTVVS